LAVLTPCTPPQGPLEPVQGDEPLGSPLHHPFLREPDPLRRRSSSSFSLRRISSLHSPSVSLASSPWFCCAGCRSPWQPAAPRMRARRRVRRPEPPLTVVPQPWSSRSLLFTLDVFPEPRRCFLAGCREVWPTRAAGTPSSGESRAAPPRVLPPASQRRPLLSPFALGRPIRSQQPRLDRESI
jgi:hypothetical protein